MNVAMLSKLCWLFLAKPETLSSKVILHKYGGWKGLCNPKENQASSYNWRSLIQVADIVRRGTRWRLGNGCTLRFWEDPWLVDSSLKEMAVQPIPAHLLNMSIHDFWKAQTGWKIYILHPYLPHAVLSLLNGVIIQTSENCWDVPTWRYSTSGLFTITSVQSLVRPPNSATTTFNWRALWRFCGPSRASLTLWLALHDAIITNHLL